MAVVFENKRLGPTSIPQRLSLARPRYTMIVDRERKFLCASFDEAHRFRKNNRNNVAVRVLSENSSQVIALTATPIQNRLEVFYLTVYYLMLMLYFTRI